MVIASLVSSGLDAEEEEEFMKQIGTVAADNGFDDIEIAKAKNTKASLISA
jgi:hypothetical protein